MTNKYSNIFIISIAVVATLTFCNVLKKTKASKKELTTIFEINDASYWPKVNPIMFMDTLKKYRSDVISITIVPSLDWYNLKYVSELQSYDSDTTRCARVISTKLNQIAIYKKTNMSQQSQYLIKGIIEKNYPPSLSSTD